MEATLWVSALSCGAVLLSHTLEARAAERKSAEIAITDSPSAAHKQADDVMGRLEIKQIGLSVPIVTNYDASSLIRGVGHVPGSALPGGLGNLVLAGHRDTFFRPLRNVKAGMEIRVVTGEGAWRYIIDRTEIVTPDAVGVTAIGDVPEMTLITCYPFEFIGAAPNRFIVHAHLISVDAG